MNHFFLHLCKLLATITEKRYRRSCFSGFLFLFRMWLYDIYWYWL